MSDDPQMTVGSLMRMLLSAAKDERFGPEAPVRFGVCDAKNLQLIDKVELVEMFEVHKATLTQTAAWLLFKAHHHPGTKPGELYPGAESEIDHELRQLLDDKGKEPPQAEE